MKTHNLLLDHHGNVKVADFGVARKQAPQQQQQREAAAAPGGSSHAMDMTGETGTLRWMAPEVRTALQKAAVGGVMFTVIMSSVSYSDESAWC